MNTNPTKAERLHLGKVKDLPCSVCGAAAPSEAHHIEQSQVYTCVALCQDCHRGSLNGWHGQKRAWTLRKANELTALNETIRGLMR